MRSFIIFLLKQISGDRLTHLCLLPISNYCCIYFFLTGYAISQTFVTRTVADNLAEPIWEMLSLWRNECTINLIDMSHSVPKKTQIDFWFILLIKSFFILASRYLAYFSVQASKLISGIFQTFNSSNWFCF